MKAAILAAAVVPLLSGCTTSPVTHFDLEGDLTITTYVTGHGCFAERGQVGSGVGEQDVGAEVDANIATQTGTGQGQVVQAGTMATILASRVGCGVPTSNLEVPAPVTP